MELENGQLEEKQSAREETTNIRITKGSHNQIRTLAKKSKLSMIDYVKEMANFFMLTKFDPCKPLANPNQGNLAILKRIDDLIAISRKVENDKINTILKLLSDILMKVSELTTPIIQDEKRFTLTQLHKRGIYCPHCGESFEQYEIKRKERKFVCKNCLFELSFILYGVKVTPLEIIMILTKGITGPIEKKEDGTFIRLYLDSDNQVQYSKD